MGAAGASARREYERRLAREAARLRANRVPLLVPTIATPIVAYLGVRFGLPWVIDSVLRSVAESGSRTTTPVDPKPYAQLALLVALAATVSVVRTLWGTRQSTTAWRIGARGEEATATRLTQLPESFRVLHDLPMPGSRANIDHVVVGPTGVFTVETKNYQSGVEIKRGTVWASGRDRSEIVDQADRQAQAIAIKTGQDVTPLIVIHGGVRVGWFSSPIVRGVRLCGPKSLVDVIASRPPMLDEAACEAAMAAITGGARSSRSDSAPVAAPTPVERPAEERCACGGRFVLRHRRSDGAPFYGCSEFPACRRTRPAPQV